MTRPPTFALLGAAGFVAPRHIDAIHAVGGRLLAACDPHDSVGVLDRYGEPVAYTRDWSEFWQWVDEAVPDFVVIATPNDRHGADASAALMLDCNVICEKPVALDGSRLAFLRTCEASSDGRVNCIMQLRHHPAVLALRERCATGVHDVEVDYVAPRGPWFDQSWKGDPRRSGGIVTNIGVHLFDLLLWIFGEEWADSSHVVEQRTAAGSMLLPRARVRWRLSTDPSETQRRVLTVDGEAVDLSDRMTTLHVESYRAILAGQGWTLEDARPAIGLCEALRGERVEVAA